MKNGNNITDYEKIVQLPTGRLIDFKNHPFNVEDDDEMLELVQNIKERGVIYPVIVRPLDDGNYEIISGHKRKRASELLKLKEVSCIIRNYTDDEATIVMVDTNLKQRQIILPSEKARAYKMKLEAMKRQGKRTDLTFTHFGEKLRANKKMSEDVGESKEQIRRYIRQGVDTVCILPTWLDRPPFIGEQVVVRIFKIIPEKRKIYSSLVKIIGSDANDWKA